MMELLSLVVRLTHATTQQIVITCISNTEIADDWKFKPVITGLNFQLSAYMLLEVTLTELKFIVEKRKH